MAAKFGLYCGADLDGSFCQEYFEGKTQEECFGPWSACQQKHRKAAGLKPYPARLLRLKFIAAQAADENLDLEGINIISDDNFLSRVRKACSGRK